VPEPATKRRLKIAAVIAGAVVVGLVTIWLMLPAIATLGMTREKTNPYAEKLIVWLDLRAFRQLFFYAEDSEFLSSTFFMKLEMAEKDRAYSKRLIRSLGDPDFQEHNGRTLLHIAAVLESVDLIRDLLAMGANPDGGGWWVDSPLVYATRRENIECVKMLLEKGANPNRKGDCGYTSLHTGAESGNVEVVTLLLKYGADIEAKDGGGRTPMHLAETKELAQLLLGQGAAINVKDNEGKTALDYRKPESELAAFLRERGAKTGTELDEEQKKGE
jgi:ankyrin repeat protein